MSDKLPTDAIEFLIGWADAEGCDEDNANDAEQQLAALLARVQEYEDLLDRAKKDDLCRDDEDHCTCVPWLRAGIHAHQKRIAELERENAEINGRYTAACITIRELEQARKGKANE